MFFHIEHTTEYFYSEPATEAFSELRLRPRDSLRQKVSRHVTEVKPAVMVEHYVDYFGNYVETVSIPFRHNKLVVTSRCEVETEPFSDALSGLDLTLSEARLLYQDRCRELHDFVRPSHHIPLSPELRKMAAQHLKPAANFANAVKDLNTWIFQTFRYMPGVTDISTPVMDVLEKRRGVCQDFAHLMIAFCRNAGIPARYVSGYIETDPIPGPGETEDTRLVGATASHAWVEIFAPNFFWVGLDPTNNIMEGERHVQIGIGRDFNDVTPLKGVFKGANTQTLSVDVRMRRADAVAPAEPVVEKPRKRKG